MVEQHVESIKNGRSGAAVAAEKKSAAETDEGGEKKLEAGEEEPGPEGTKAPAPI